jgi:tetratricopeptide (TPR) repeat protein/nitrate/TMAO reductase-like tetraheme cytochrome c subunit
MPPSARFLRRPVLGLSALLAASAAWAAADWFRSEPPEALAKAQYVGRQSCIQCHQAEAAAWTGSDHDWAMDTATDETVLGDFNDASFTRFDETTRFFRDGKKFMVNAEGPDGKNHDYQVKYTFGVRPLQQYMVEFPDGRIQVLRVSWDVKNKKWFYVAPADAMEERIKPDDPLHWTGLAQNWNTMCAECHVTDYHKNYDLEKNSYHSTYREDDVSCEMCHGPGSVHVKLAERRSLFWDRRVGYGLTNTLKNASTQKVMETCAPCHSRRAMIRADYHAGTAFLDSFQPSLLEAGLYHADGQILDEVYEYGSFTQSKMYHKGVKCNDCHDPHSLKLKYDGNRLCAQCHQPGKYDGAGHNHHPDSKAAAPETQCVTCHMPTHVYMGIDERRDHSIRVPRPDLTVELGTPNVCNRCHTEPQKDAKWATDWIVKWYGEKRPDDPHYAPALAAAQRGSPGGDELIEQALQRQATPDIVRATLVELLGHYATPTAEKLRSEALDDHHPLVRAAAVRAFTQQMSDLKTQMEQLQAVGDSAAEAEASRLGKTLFEIVKQLAPKLEDRVRDVRLEAASLLVMASEQISKTMFREKLDAAVAEYRATQTVNSDRAQANRNLANVSLQLGEKVAAVESFRTAIRQEPYLTGPRTELSQLLDQMLSNPKDADAGRRLGATHEEVTKLREEEGDLLARDAHLLKGDPFPHYRRGRLLYLLGDLDQAREAFAEATRLGPDDYEYWLWLALICERQQRWDDAVAALKQMKRLRPRSNEWMGIAYRMQQTIDAQAKDDIASSQPSSNADNNKPPSVPPAGENIAPLPESPDSGLLAPPPATPGEKHTPPDLKEP